LWLNATVLKVLGYADAGTNMILGPLASGQFYPGQKRPYFILATQTLPKVIFFSALVGLLYYVGIMRWIVGLFARVFTKLMKISGAEALSVSSNIFVGIESAFLVRPYYATMTRSELCTVLAGCMATVASTVLALYVDALKGPFPSIAGHLISASLLSAPAVLVVAKLSLPETERPDTLGKVTQGEYTPADNWIDAIVRNAMDGVKLAVGIAAMLIAFKGLVAMTDGFLGWIGTSISYPELSLKNILGAMFTPFVWLMGVPSGDISQVAQLLGTRMVETEVPSYFGLGAMMQSGAISPRGAVIASYSLCGFAHLPSIAIFVGGISALVPSRSKDLSALAFRALFIATLACMMTGAAAGVFYTGPHILNAGTTQKAKKTKKKQNKKVKTKKATQRPAARKAQQVRVAPNTRTAPVRRVAPKPRKTAPGTTPRPKPTSRPA
jgi:CNT family concentrative nucleoside transporter